MDFVDNILDHIDSEAELKKPINALVCFTEIETGKILSTLAAYFALSRSEKSAITFLHLLSEEEGPQQTMGEEVYQNETFKNLIELGDKSEKSKITIRSFVENTDDNVSNILKTSREQKCNLVLIGINNKLSPRLWNKYSKLKGDSTKSEAYIQKQFQPDEAHLLNEIFTLLEMNPVASGVFINNGLRDINKIFVPILTSADIQILPFVYIHLAQKEDVELMIWDAIGTIQSNPKRNKLYQSFVKKTDERIYLWDNDKKIEQDFIQQQDLLIIGIDGWNKLINAALPWTESLPSTLIIKDKLT